MESLADDAKNHPFSLMDDCMDAGGRAMHGAIAEKARMRGYRIRPCSRRIDPLSPAISLRERAYTESLQT